MGIYLFPISFTEQEMLYEMSLSRHQFHATQNEFLNLKISDISIKTKKHP